MSDNDPSWPDSTEGGGGEAGPRGPAEPRDHDRSVGEGSGTPPPPPPPPSSAPDASGGATATNNATLGVRFGARLLDGLVLLVISFVLGLVLPLGNQFVAGIVGAIVGLAYYVGLETTQGATFGKQVLSLTVHGADGGYPSPEESFKRNIFYAFGVVPVIGGLASLAFAIAIAVTISSSDDNRGIHDNFADTTVTKG